MKMTKVLSIYQTKVNLTEAIEGAAESSLAEGWETWAPNIIVGLLKQPANSSVRHQIQSSFLQPVKMVNIVLNNKFLKH